MLEDHKEELEQLGESTADAIMIITLLGIEVDRRQLDERQIGVLFDALDKGARDQVASTLGDLVAPEGLGGMFAERFRELVGKGIERRMTMYRESLLNLRRKNAGLDLNTALDNL